MTSLQTTREQSPCSWDAISMQCVFNGEAFKRRGGGAGGGGGKRSGRWDRMEMEGSNGTEEEGRQKATHSGIQRNPNHNPSLNKFEVNGH